MEFLESIEPTNCHKISALSVNFEYSQERLFKYGWGQQGEAHFAITLREQLLGLVEANGFLPEYPVAGQVFFAEVHTIRDIIESDNFDAGCLGWDEEPTPEDVYLLEYESLHDGYAP